MKKRAQNNRVSSPLDALVGYVAVVLAMLCLLVGLWAIMALVRVIGVL